MATKDFNTATLTPKLVQYQVTSANTVSTVYQVPVGRCFKAESLIICSRHTASLIIHVYVTPSSGGVAGTPADLNKIISSYSLAANETLSLRSIAKGLMLGELDTLSIYVTGTGSVVTVSLSGVEGA